MSQLPDTRDSLIVRLAEPSDEAAWQEFSRNYESAVMRYARGHGLQDADAREVVQEVLLLVHRQISNWKSSGNPGSFRAWLLRSTHFLCLKSIRNRSRIDRGLGGTSVRRKLEACADAEATHEAETLEWRRWAFSWGAEQTASEVDTTTWQAFWLSAVEGRPPTEIAQQLGVRVGTVYTCKCRVLARIRRHVQELSEEMQ